MIPPGSGETDFFFLPVKEIRGRKDMLLYREFWRNHPMIPGNSGFLLEYLVSLMKNKMGSNGKSNRI